VHLVDSRVFGGYGGRANGLKIQAPKLKATPDDPWLERIGTPVSGFGGKGVPLRVHGEPGSFTRLLLGKRSQVLANPAVEIELLLERIWTYDLGFIPAKGSVDHVIPMGPDWPKEVHDGSRLLLAQAMCTYPGGENRPTNIGADGAALSTRTRGAPEKAAASRPAARPRIRSTRRQSRRSA
jgi:hypothetical protein